MAKNYSMINQKIDLNVTVRNMFHWQGSKAGEANIIILLRSEIRFVSFMSAYKISFSARYARETHARLTKDCYLSPSSFRVPKHCLTHTTVEAPAAFSFMITLHFHIFLLERISKIRSSLKRVHSSNAKTACSSIHPRSAAPRADAYGFWMGMLDSESNLIISSRSKSPLFKTLLNCRNDDLSHSGASKVKRISDSDAGRVGLKT